MVKGDLTRARWARTLNRLRRNAEELKAYDFQVIEPPNVELPPEKRYAQGGPVTTTTVIIGEHGPEGLVDKRGHPL
jgi:hypothetical protein